MRCHAGIFNEGPEIRILLNLGLNSVITVWMIGFVDVYSTMAYCVDTYSSVTGFANSSIFTTARNSSTSANPIFNSIDTSVFVDEGILEESWDLRMWIRKCSRIGFKVGYAHLLSDVT